MKISDNRINELQKLQYQILKNCNIMNELKLSLFTSAYDLELTVKCESKTEATNGVNAICLYLAEKSLSEYFSVRYEKDYYNTIIFEFNRKDHRDEIDNVITFLKMAL